MEHLCNYESGVGDFNSFITRSYQLKVVAAPRYDVRNSLIILVSIANPAGPLCEGSYAFVMVHLRLLCLDRYFFYQWSNGMVGTTATIGFAGMAAVTVTNLMDL
jgi:hypothetical protein